MTNVMPQSYLVNFFVYMLTYVYAWALWVFDQRLWVIIRIYFEMCCQAVFATADGPQMKIFKAFNSFDH